MSTTNDNSNPAPLTGSASQPAPSVTPERSAVVSVIMQVKNGAQGGKEVVGKLPRDKA